MNTIENELMGYIGGTEKMSGFDSYDSAEGDYNYFDDDNMDDAQSFFDGDSMSYATGASAPAQISDPYVIQYYNPTGATINGILFGFNDYSTATNYGNAGLEVTNLLSNTGVNTGYGRLINQSATKVFQIGKLRFSAAGTSPAIQLAQTVTTFHVDGNGNQYSKPMNLSIERDAYQQQSDILDVTKLITVDANTYLTFPVLAGTYFTVTMFPTQLISGKAQLNGGQARVQARAPRLSGRNVAPVVIQTTQNVRGIQKI